MFVDNVESGMPGSFAAKDVSAVLEGGRNDGSSPPTSGHLSRAVIPASRSSHSFDHNSSSSSSFSSLSSSSIERTAKVRVVEVPHPRIPRLSQLHTFLYLQRSKMESRRVRAALEDRATTARQYEHDRALLLQRAAAYERQLQEISATHAATEQKFQDIIDDRLREITSLKDDLGEKNSVIEEIELRCDELNVALTMVREELNEEREKSRVGWEKEMRDLEARLMSRITQVRHELFLALHLIEMLGPQQSNNDAMGCSSRTAPDKVGVSQPRPTGAPDQPIDHHTTPSSSPRTSLAIIQPASCVQSVSTSRASRSTPQVSSQVLEQSSPVSISPRSRDNPAPRSCLSAPSSSSSDDEDLSTPSKSSPSNRLPPLSPPTQREHAQLQSVQKAVNAEKERFKKSDDRDVHLTQVRRLFSETFQAPADEDFYRVHVAAPREEVDQYLDGVGHGPDTADLHFTDQEPHNNAWNCAVCGHLARMLWDRQGREQWTTKKGRRAANASEAYWQDAVLQKFKRVRRGWLDARQKVIQDPTTGRNRVESVEEAETRRFGKGEETRTVARQRERRFKVC